MVTCSDRKSALYGLRRYHRHLLHSLYFLCLACVLPSTIKIVNPFEHGFGTFAFDVIANVPLVTGDESRRYILSPLNSSGGY